MPHRMTLHVCKVFRAFSGSHSNCCTTAGYHGERPDSTGESLSLHKKAGRTAAPSKAVTPLILPLAVASRHAAGGVGQRFRKVGSARVRCAWFYSIWGL